MFVFHFFPSKEMPRMVWLSVGTWWNAGTAATWEVVAKCSWVVRPRAALWHWTFTFGQRLSRHQMTSEAAHTKWWFENPDIYILLLYVYTILYKYYVYIYMYIYIYTYVCVISFFKNIFKTLHKTSCRLSHFFSVARLASELELGGFVGSVGFVPTDSKGWLGRNGVIYVICYPLVN